MQITTLGDGAPEVAIVGAIHGDEPCGAHAVATLAETAPPVDRPVALVLANEEALERDVRYVDADLNRSFPGDADAETHEGRLAAELTDELADCTTLSLHSTRSYGGCFALVDVVGPLARTLCPQLSIDALVETGAKDGRIFSGIPDTIEVECGYQGTDAAADNAVAIACEFLAATDALADPAWRPGTASPDAGPSDEHFGRERADRDRAGGVEGAPADGRGSATAAHTSTDGSESSADGSESSTTEPSTDTPSQGGDTAGPPHRVTYEDRPPGAIPVFRLEDAIPKDHAERYEVFVENFEAVTAGEVVAAMDDQDLVAEESFHPVLLSPDGYEDVFGYRAQRIGSLEPAQ